LRYVEHRPPPPLDLGVECVWLAESDATEPRAIERILPDGCLELIVHLGSRSSAGRLPISANVSLGPS